MLGYSWYAKAWKVRQVHRGNGRGIGDTTLRRVPNMTRYRRNICQLFTLILPFWFRFRVWVRVRVRNRDRVERRVRVRAGASAKVRVRLRVVGGSGNKK